MNSVQINRRSNDEWQVRSLHIAIIVLFAIVFLIPTLSDTLNILFDSAGYPMYFYHVDSPWTLQYVHSLNQDLKYPPSDLGSDLPSMKYQHGVAFLAYLMNLLPSVTAYQALLVYLPIAMYTALFIFIYRIAKSIHGRPGPLFLLILFMLMFVRDGDYDILRPIHGFRVLTYMENNIFRLNQYTQLQGLSGYLLLFIAIHSTYFRKSYAASRISIFLMPFFKASNFPLCMAMLGAEILFELRKRQRRLYITDMSILIASAAILKLFIMPNEYYDDLIQGHPYRHNGAWFRLQPFSIINMMQWVKLAFLSIPFLLLVPSLVRKGMDERTEKLVLVLLVNVLIFSLVYVDTPNKMQFTAPIALVIITLNALAYEKLRTAGSVILVPILAVHLVYFGVSNILGGLRCGIETMLDPSKGHEYVNNRPLGEVLGSLEAGPKHLLATNDQRYPAENFKRRDRQFQMSGLFGHRFFNADVHYSFIYFNGDSATRRREFDVRKRVTTTLCDPSRSLTAESKSLMSLGLTHVILHLKYPHIDYTGCRILKANEDYALIELDGAGSAKSETYTVTAKDSVTKPID